MLILFYNYKCCLGLRGYLLCRIMMTILWDTFARDHHHHHHHQAPLVHLEKLLFHKLGLGKLPPVRRIKAE